MGERGIAVRASFISGPGAIRIDEVEEPVPDADGIVADIVSCSICATDAHYFADGGEGVPPSIFGHEWLGRVREVGAQVTDLEPGQLVAVTVAAPCGTCAACRRGQGDVCSTNLQQARGRDDAAPAWGGFSERIGVSATRVVPVPESMPAEIGELLEPAAVAHRGVRRVGVEVGDLVVVQGGGAIGQFAAQWAALMGAHRVMVVEPSAARRELALKLGADEAMAPGDAEDRLLQLSDGCGADLVLECTGIASLVHTASTFVRRGGRLGILGWPMTPSTIPMRDWLTREIQVVASMGYSRADTVTTVRFAADGRLRASGMANLRVGFADLKATLDGMNDRTIDVPRVVFDPTLDRVG